MTCHTGTWHVTGEHDRSEARYDRSPGWLTGRSLRPRQFPKADRASKRPQSRWAGASHGLALFKRVSLLKSRHCDGAMGTPYDCQLCNPSSLSSSVTGVRTFLLSCFHWDQLFCNRATLVVCPQWFSFGVIKSLILFFIPRARLRINQWCPIIYSVIRKKTSAQAKRPKLSLHFTSTSNITSLAFMAR